MKTDDTANYRLSFPIINELANRTLIAVTLAYIAGIGVCRFWFAQPSAAFWVAGLLLALLILAVYFRVFTLYRAVLVLLAAAAGGAAFYYAVQQPSYGLTHYAGSPVYIEGTVIEEPLFHDDHTAYRLRVEVVETRAERYPVSGTLLVKVFGCGDGYWFGERLRLRGTITEARGQRNPGGFDYRFFLRSQGLDALIYPAPAAVSSLGPGEVGLHAASAVRLRSSMVENISAALPSPSAELLTAILFGQRHRLPDSIEDNFRRAGAGHLMAVSGLHVGLAAVLILGLVRHFNLRGRLPLVLAIVLVFAYAYLTGMRPSALRAAIMVSMALGAILLDREHDLPTTIAFAALVTLFINPLLLFTIGFQLSYAATMVLVYTYRPLEKLLAALRCPRFLRAPLAVTAAAQVGVLPLCVYYFHSLPTGALLFNLLLLPLIAFVVGLGLAGALAGLVYPPVGEILLWAARPLLETMLYITGLSSPAVFYVTLSPPGPSLLFAYYGVLFAVLSIYYRWEKQDRGNEQTSFSAYLKSVISDSLLAWRYRYRVFGFAVLALAVAFVWTGILFPRQALLTVTFIDVGQGAAALIEPPCGLVIMIDAGGRPEFQGDPGEIGEKVVLPYLRHRGIRSIDLAVITHPHEDHFGGFIPMVGQISLVEILVSPIGGGSGHYSELLENAANAGSEIRMISDGQVWHCGADLLFEVIGPPEKMLRGTSSDLNNNSIVFILHYGDISMLFTGDVEDAAVRNLLQREVDIRSDVLLVPHHGGYLEEMPALLDAVRPSLAVIQVGTNPFGHPHPYVTAALEDADVAVYRNDYDGAVIIETDGRRLQVTTQEQSAVY